METTDKEKLINLFTKLDLPMNFTPTWDVTGNTIQILDGAAYDDTGKVVDFHGGYE